MLRAVAATGSASDVVGPASATDGAAAVFDGTTGKLLKDSKIILTIPATAATLTLVASTTITGPSASTTLPGLSLNNLFTANGALSSGAGPGAAFNGTWIAGGSATTTKPYILIETTGATSASWGTNGAGFGINTASGFIGDLIRGQVNGTSNGQYVLGVQGASGTSLMMYLQSDNTNGWAVCPSAMQLGSGLEVAWMNGAVAGINTPSAADLRLNRRGAANLSHGGVDSATPTAQTISFQGSRSGTDTNIGGANATINPSLGTGTGTPANIIINGVVGATTGTGAQTVSAAITVAGVVNGQLPSVVLGSAAIATNATDGFLYIPTCAGSPSGTPTTKTGRVALVYDTSAHQFWIYDTAWKQPKTPAGAAIVTWQ